MLIRQIVLPVEKYFFYKAKISREITEYNWEIMSSGETEKAKKMKQQIEIDKQELGKLLDMEI